MIKNNNAVTSDSPNLRQLLSIGEVIDSDSQEHIEKSVWFSSG